MEQLANFQIYIAIFTKLADLAEKYGVPAVNRLIDAAHKPDPTGQDWKEMFSVATINTDKFQDRIAKLEAQVAAQAAAQPASAPVPAVV